MYHLVTALLYPNSCVMIYYAALTSGDAGLYMCKGSLTHAQPLVI